MDEAIKNLCQSLIEEAQSVIANTDRIVEAHRNSMTMHNPEEILRAYGINRLDSIEHIQNLTIALTNAVTDVVGNSETKEGGSNEQ